MSTVIAAELPADRPAARWMLDVLLTVGAGLSVLPPLLSESHQHPAWQIVAAAMLSAPLLVRRIWPVEVFACLFAMAIGLQIWDQHAVCGVALLIALYTVAERRSRRAALIATATLEVGVIVTAVRVAGSNWWYDTIFLTGMLGAALGLGLYAATRRAYLTELHDRAQQLERERDQQGALAAAAERARIAREMHDIVAHNLTVIVRLSDGAIAASATSPEQATEVMRSVSATGRRALADTRRLLGVLRQSGGEESADEFQPLPDLAELDHLGAQVRSAGLPTTLEIQGVTGHVPTGMQLTVYRLVQGGAHQHPETCRSQCSCCRPSQLPPRRTGCRG